LSAFVLNGTGITGAHDECLVAVSDRFHCSQSYKACGVTTGWVKFKQTSVIRL